ncbi:hypothetical protein LA080_005262 [Diaporthe eres]|nr:hypothetical protein LA080_005262 [Diaporthe eres]
MASPKTLQERKQEKDRAPESQMNLRSSSQDPDGEKTQQHEILTPRVQEKSVDASLVSMWRLRAECLLNPVPHLHFSSDAGVDFDALFDGLQELLGPQVLPLMADAQIQR